MDSTIIIITVVLELALYAMFKASSSISLDRQRQVHLQECKKRQAEARSLGLDPTMWDMGAHKRRNGF